MKKETCILFTSGRGPIECALAVQGIQRKFRNYLNAKQLNFEIVNQRKGTISKSLETIIFKIDASDKKVFDPWIGTIQWICKSPIRKFHRRKNWFIKCEEIEMAIQKEANLKDVSIQSYRASGPGGQHRNKVETAIRLMHRSTGLIVTASDGKSQAQNKKKAWKKLKTKLTQLQNMEIQNSNMDQWSDQIEIERGNPVRIFRGTKFTE